MRADVLITQAERGFAFSGGLVGKTQPGGIIRNAMRVRLVDWRSTWVTHCLLFYLFGSGCPMVRRMSSFNAESFGSSGGVMRVASKS